MISAFITSAWGWFAKLPRGFHIAIGAVIGSRYDALSLLFLLHTRTIQEQK